MRISDWSSDVCSSDLISNSFMRISIALRYILKRSLQGAISSRAALSPISAANLDFLPDPAKSASVLSGPWSRQFRSEEHTSELQSLMRISYAVFCLTKNTQVQQ